MLYDVIIVGGGINGAGVFRDLALHGLKVLLLEKGDFSSQTSQGSSKMLHGGIRYLENFDFSLVQEALEEKNLWLKLAPHLCVEREFHLPVYADGKWPLPLVRTGLWIYDLLSHFQNRPAGMVDAETLLERFPQLRQSGLRGAGTYYDGIVDDHKLALECIWDGELEPNAEAQNYQEVMTIQTDRGYQVTVRDRITGKITQHNSRFLVVTTGPFTDHLMRQWNLPWTPALLPSKGIHLWLREGILNLQGPMVLPSQDGRVVFVIPQKERGGVLIGTTETPVEGDYYDIKANSQDVSYLLRMLRDYFPQVTINESHILNTFAAIRPLVRAADTSDRGKTSRTHQVFRPTSTSYVLLGGKYTTFRRMAQDIAKELVPRTGRPYQAQLTLNPLRQSSVIGTFQHNLVTREKLELIISREKPRTFEDLVHRRLSWITRTHELQELAGQPRSFWEEKLR